MIKRILGVLALAAALAGTVRAQNTTTFGNITALGVPCGAANCVYYQLPPGTPWVVITAAGSWAGTLETATTSASNANYSNLDTLTWTVLATGTANGTWSASTSGATYLRVRATAWTSGTANIRMSASQALAPLMNPVFPGQVTATGMRAANGGSGSQCWFTDGTSGACSSVAPGGTANSIQGQDGLGHLTGGPATVDKTTGAVSASVNSQINVMMYGAKGDCSTDDTAAFTAAQNAALAYQGLPASIFLPKPPGGCYIVNDFVWQGASLIGQPSGIAGAGSHKYNVMLASSPGHDILHVPDPLTASSRVTLYGGWQILNVTFSVGNTTAPAIASVKHRWPGRWSDDSNVTSGSQIITVSTSTPFTCGDVGQAITVGGAGATATTDTLAAAITTTAKTVTLTTGLTASWPSIFAYIKIDSEIMLVEVQDYTNGTVTFTNVQRAQAGTTAATHAASAAVTVMGNLTTTLASVSPCWVSPTTPSFTTVKLTAAATTTISNAHTYLSVLGLPVTENIGNCAIAMDMQDGLSSDWNTTLLTDVRPKMNNVFFETATGDKSNDVCGIYTQGNPTLYGLQMSNFMFYNDKFAVVQATSELNAYQQSSSGDYEHWLDGIFFFDWAPWISYNGLSQNFDNVQQSSSAGFQILNASNSAFDSSCDWHMKNMGMEADGASTYGWHVTGCQIAFNAVAFTSGSQIAYLDTNNSTCTKCSGIISLNGYGNHGEWGSITSMSGFDNSTSTSYIGNPVFGYPAGYDISGLPYKGKYNLVGRFTADSAFDENTVGTYNKDDLILWPQDFLITPQSNWTTTIIADSTSPSGYYIDMASPSAGSLSQWAQFVDQGQNTGNHSIYVGSTIPDTGVDVYFQAKCPSGTSSFTFNAFVWGATGAARTFNCSTTYQKYKVAFPFTAAANGSWFGLQQGGATEWDVAYFVIVPWKGSYNGFQPQPSDGSVFFSPNSVTFGSSTKLVPDSASPYGVSFSEVAADYVHTLNGSSNLNGGALYPAVPSKVNYWVGAPAVFTDTLGASALSTDTTLTLGTATTSTWGSSGYIIIDQEVMQYTGVTAGLTSITVARGQYGTTAQAHSNGAAINSVGTGQLGIKCNSTFVSNINVYYAPVYTQFSAPFPAQNCSGYLSQVAFLGFPGGPTGQTWNLAQIKISQDEDQFATPTAANQVPVSAAYGGQFAFNTTKALAGSGTGITTGPTSGTTANHVATFSGTTGQIQDGGALPTTPTGTSTLTVGTTAISANSCSAGATVTITGITTSSVLSITPASDISAVTGWSPAGSTLYFVTWPTANTFNYKVCNNSAASITPGSSTTWNIGAIF